MPPNHCLQSRGLAYFFFCWGILQWSSYRAPLGNPKPLCWQRVTHRQYLPCICIVLGGRVQLGTLSVLPCLCAWKAAFSTSLPLGVLLGPVQRGVSSPVSQGWAGGRVHGAQGNRGSRTIREWAGKSSLPCVQRGLSISLILEGSMRSFLSCCIGPALQSPPLTPG